MSAADDGDRPEKRAGELMRAGGPVVDPALAAQLRAFFTDGGPAYQPQPAWEAPPGWNISEDAEQVARREVAMTAVAPRLLRRLEAKSAAADVISPEPPPSMLDVSLLRFDFDAWRLQFAGDPRELELSGEVIERLNEVAPQAVLRDLHRPVIEFPLTLQPMVLDEAAEDPIVVRAVMSQDHRIRLHDLPSPRQMLIESIAERRHWIRTVKWADCKPTEPTSLPSWRPDANDLKWFGA